MASPAAGDDICNERRVSEPRDFPMGMVVILCIAMTINSYTLVSLFPYVGVMVKELLSLETTNEAGFYAGYVASAFTFGRFVSGYFWGYFIDSVGRKPTIIIGLLSIATFSVSFGMSPTYSWAISSRLVLGLTNGIMPALRTSLNEVCGPEHLVVGMTMLSSCRAFSMVLGTGVGGLLSQPAVHHPNVFSPTGLFGRYPYLLPNLVGACCAVIVMVFVVIFLPETKDYAADAKTSHTPLRSNSSVKVDDTSHEATDAVIDDPSSGHAPVSNPVVDRTSKYQELTTSADADPATADATDNDEIDGGELGGGSGGEGGRARGGSRSAGGGAYELSATDNQRGEEGEPLWQGEEEGKVGLFGRDGLLAIPNVRNVLVLGCTVQTIQIGFEEAYPLFALSTPDVGGLGWNTVQIGRVFVLTGLLMAAFQLSMFPPIIKAIGLTAWQRIGFILSSLAFLTVPAVKMVSWNYASLYAASVAANTLVNCGMSAAVLNLSIASTTIVPRSKRGKMGGLYNTAESLGRFLGPAGFSVTYAWSISSTGVAGAHDWVNYRFVFYASAVVLALCGSMAWQTLTHENLMVEEEREGPGVAGPAGVEGDGGDGGDIVLFETTTSSPLSTDTGDGGLERHKREGDGVSFDTSFLSGANGRREADLV